MTTGEVINLETITFVIRTNLSSLFNHSIEVHKNLLERNFHALLVAFADHCLLGGVREGNQRGMERQIVRLILMIFFFFFLLKRESI